MNGVDTTSIVNSEISVADGLNNGIRIDPEAGATAIQDVDIEIDGSANAVQIHGQDAGAVDLQDVRITGDADGSTMRHAILCTRNGCRFDELSVEQHGPNKRRGIELRATTRPSSTRSSRRRTRRSSSTVRMTSRSRTVMPTPWMM